MAVLPIPLALVVCDHVWRDPNTNKRSMLGTFSAVELPEYPGEYPEIAIYLAMTDGHGKMRLSIQLIDSSETFADPIATAELEVEFNNPTTIIETEGVLRDVLFPFPGEYRLQVLARGSILIERRIFAIVGTQQ